MLGIPCTIFYRWYDCYVEGGLDALADNALAETINGLYKTELVYYQGPWHNMQALELAILGWVDWFNKRRVTRSIWSREIKLKVSSETGAPVAGLAQ